MLNTYNNKKQSIEKLKAQLDEIEKETQAQMQEIENNNTELNVSEKFYCRDHSFFVVINRIDRVPAETESETDLPRKMWVQNALKLQFLDLTE